jgi:hypothetical protein
MTKLAPAPSLPIDLLPAANRRESALLPSSTPLPERGPEINRTHERASLLATLDSTQTPLNTPTGLAVKSLSPTNLAQPQPASPLTAQSAREAQAQSQDPSPSQGGFFSQLKDKFLQFIGLTNAHKTPESGDAPKGFLARVATQISHLSEARSLSDLAAWTKGMVYAIAPRLCAWAKPVPKITTPQSLNIRPVAYHSTNEEWKKPSETFVITTPDEKPLALTSTKPKGPSLTEQALTAVATATQAQVEEKEKKQSQEESDGRRNKESAQTTLRKLQMEGLSAAELSEISAELNGVYGTAEVALRNARDLLTRKKTS